MDYRDVNQGDELERLILEVFSSIEARFESAQVSVLDSPKPRRLRLSSTSPNTAAVEVVPDPGQVDISIGREGRIELLRPASLEESAELVRSIADAASDGRFEETFWTVCGISVRSTARICGGDGQTILSKHRRVLWSLVPGKRIDVRYAPYA